MAKALGEFTGSLRYGDLPDQVVHTVKLRIIDTLASAMAAVRLGRDRIIDELYVTPGEAAVWGSDRKRSVRDATVLNSFRSHASYLDDGDRFSGAHPGCVVIPPLLALCAAEKRTAKELIASIVSGYEVLLRVGQAIYPSTVTRGFQSTAVLGAIGSAAGCANLMRLSPDAATSAIAIDVIDLLLSSRDRRASIDRIEIAVDTVTYAGENHAPKTGDEAQFSIPFAVALSLHKHSTSPFEFTDDNLHNDLFSTPIRNSSSTE